MCTVPSQNTLRNDSLSDLLRRLALLNECSETFRFKPCRSGRSTSKIKLSKVHFDSRGSGDGPVCPSLRELWDKFVDWAPEVSDTRHSFKNLNLSWCERSPLGSSERVRVRQGRGRLVYWSWNDFSLPLCKDVLCQADWLSEAQLTFFLNAFTFPTPASLIYFLTASHPLFCSIKPLIWIWRTGNAVYCSAESSSIIRDATDLSELCVRLCGFMRFCNRTHSVRSSSPVPSLRYQKLIRQ